MNFFIERRCKMAALTKLRKLRKYHELTIKDMAKLINVDPRTYIKKENGVSQFKANEMFIIAKKFNKTVDEIFLPENFMEHEETEGDGNENAKIKS